MNSQKTNPLARYGPVLLAGALFMAGSLAPNLISSNQLHKVRINAHGQANLQVPPDTAKLSVSVSVKLASTTGEATSMIGDKVDKFCKEIEKLEGVNFSLETLKLDQKILGVSNKYARSYNARQSVKLKISNFLQIQPVIDAAIKHGFNEIGSVNYSLDSKKTYRNKAREIAVAAARENGTSIAAGLGMKIGKMLDYSETISGYSYSESEELTFLDAASTSSTGSTIGSNIGNTSGKSTKTNPRMPNPIAVRHSVTMDFELN
jgi:uncharacterized protein